MGSRPRYQIRTQHYPYQQLKKKVVAHISILVTDINFFVNYFRVINNKNNLVYVQSKNIQNVLIAYFILYVINMKYKTFTRGTE